MGTSYRICLFLDWGNEILGLRKWDLDQPKHKIGSRKHVYTLHSLICPNPNPNSAGLGAVLTCGKRLIHIFKNLFSVFRGDGLLSRAIY